MNSVEVIYWYYLFYVKEIGSKLHAHIDKNVSSDKKEMNLEKYLCIRNAHMPFPIIF